MAEPVRIKARRRTRPIVALPVFRGELPGSADMLDGLGRRIEYLRISVTDKCNLRCQYCTPAEGLAGIRREDHLSFREIEAVVRELALRGLRSVRITGGEPLVRPGLPELVERLRGIPGIRDLSLSTNGILLARSAADLRAAGLDRVNVSLDSLRPERADAIARRIDVLPRILEGLEAAEQVGFHPLKVNMVVLRGWNDDEIEDFARLTLTRPLHIRFIELMPTGSNVAISAAGLVPTREVLDRLGRIGRLIPVEGPTGSGPAACFRFPAGEGTVGTIAPMSHNFCDSCNRLRLTAAGQLRPCLFGAIQTDLRNPLRRGDELWPLIRDTLRIKPPRHYLVPGSDSGCGGLVALSQTGG